MHGSANMFVILDKSEPVLHIINKKGHTIVGTTQVSPGFLFARTTEIDDSFRLIGGKVEI